MLTLTQSDPMKMQTGVQNNSGACGGDMWDIVFTTTFTCKRCQYRTTYLRDVERHIIYAHCGEVPYQCAACLSLFLSSSEALEHVQQLHGSRSRHIIENGPARWRQFQTFISRCNLVLDVDHVAGTLFLCALCEQMRTHDFSEMLRHLVSTHKWWLAQPTTTCNVCAYQRIARISELDILRVEDLMSYNGHALGACLRSCFKIVLRNSSANEAWGSSASLLQRMGFQAYPMAPGFKDPMDRRKVTFMWQPNSIPVGMSSSPTPAAPTPPSPFTSGASCDCGDSSFCPVLPVQNSQPLGASTLQLMEAINQRYRGQNTSTTTANNNVNNDLNSIMRRPSLRGRWRRRGNDLPLRNPGLLRSRSMSFDGPGQTSAERLASLCANSLSGNTPSGAQPTNATPIKQEDGRPAMDPGLIFSLLQNQHLSASAALLLNQRNTSSGKAFLPPRSPVDDKRTLTGRLAAMWGGTEPFSTGASGLSNGATTTSGSNPDQKAKSSPEVTQSGFWATDTASSDESNGTKDQISSLESYMSNKYLSDVSKEYLKGRLQPGSFSETLDNLAKQAAASAPEIKESQYNYDATKGYSNSSHKTTGAAVEDAMPDSSMAFSSDASDHDGSEHPGTPLDLSKMESKSADENEDDNMDYEEAEEEDEADDNVSPEYEPIKPDRKGLVNIIPVDLSLSKKRKRYAFSGLPLDLTRKEDIRLAEKEVPPTRSRVSGHSRKQSMPSKAVIEDFSEAAERGDQDRDPANEDLMRVLDRFFGDIGGGPFGNSAMGEIGSSRPPSESDDMASPHSGTGSDISKRHLNKSPSSKPASSGSRSSTPPKASAAEASGDAMNSSGRQSKSPVPANDPAEGKDSNPDTGGGGDEAESKAQPAEDTPGCKPERASSPCPSTDSEATEKDYVTRPVGRLIDLTEEA